MAREGISVGFQDGTFRPSISVTRAQMASFLDRTLDLEAGEDPGYPDMPITATHGQAVANLAADQALRTPG